MTYGKGVDGVPVNPDEKMDSIQLEYTYLLTSQLESQRRYFEEKIARLETNAQRDMDEMVAQTRTSTDEFKALQDKVDSIMKEKSKNEQRLSAANARVNKLVHDLKEEKQMNENLMHNQQAWQKKCSEMQKQSNEKMKEKDKEIQELRVSFNRALVPSIENVCRSTQRCCIFKRRRCSNQRFLCFNFCS